MLRFLLGRGRDSICVSQVLKSLNFKPRFNEAQALVYAIQYCAAGHQPASISQGERRRRCLFYQFWEDFRPPSCSAVSGFRWLCTYATMQKYLPRELERVVYKHQALADAQLRWLCLSNTIRAGEHEYHFFVQYYALSLFIWKYLESYLGP